MRLFAIILLAAAQALPAKDSPSPDEARRSGMLETLQTYIEQNAVIVDICVYEAEWIPPSKDFWKGRLVQRAVVTHVHRGTLKVGDRIAYTHYFENDPGTYQKGTSPVPGKLLTFFLDPGESDKVVDGTLEVSGDGHWGFDRVGDEFADLFALELKTNPKLKRDSAGSQSR